MSGTFAALSLEELAGVSGGFSATKVKAIESSAIKYATHELGGGPVFLGDVTNSTNARVFTKSGVLVSTGDEANTQFYVGRVLINKRGKPTGMKDM